MAEKLAESIENEETRWRQNFGDECQVVFYFNDTLSISFLKDCPAYLPFVEAILIFTKIQLP
jgi:hypothetical protein